MSGGPGRGWAAGLLRGEGPGAGGVGEVGRQALPGGDTFADQHCEAEGEGAGPVVQDGMTKVFVAGVQPGEGSVLAGIRDAGWSARVSKRVAR